MNMTTTCTLAALLFAGSAHAQDASGCPGLPADTGLSWESRSTADTEFCRALRADGSEAFGLYISPKPNFEPERGNRGERGQLGRQDVVWYRAELANQPGIEARETLLQLADGRYVHAWLQAPSATELATTLRLLGALQFDPGNDGQVAGN